MLNDLNLELLVQVYFVNKCCFREVLGIKLKIEKSRNYTSNILVHQSMCM